MRLEDVHGAQIHALGVAFPPMDVAGEKSFLMPVNMLLEDTVLRFATAQPLCRQGHTVFFAAIDGIDPQYSFELADGSEQSFTAEPGLDSGFDAGGIHIVTLTYDQARFLRRLDGKLVVGEGVNLYMHEGKLSAIEEGSFHYWVYQNGCFMRVDVECCFAPAQLTLLPVSEPFEPPFAQELSLGGPRRRWWQKLSVTTGEGFVVIPGEYDVAQIYADGQLAADHFYTGVDWRVPASLLWGHECYLVLSERRDDFYLER